MPRQRPSTRQRRSDDELRRVSEHLAYEVGMMDVLGRAQEAGLVKRGSPVSDAILKAATQAVPDTDPNVFVEATSNALLEAFLIHFRCVLEFLYPKNRPDDVVASDFFNDPDEWERVRKNKSALLERAETRAGKEVAHLTYKRTMNPADKEWNVSEIARELQMAFDKFLQHADRLSPSWSHQQSPADKSKVGPISVTLPTTGATSSATIVSTGSLRKIIR
jgi:hypothetical protein